MWNIWAITLYKFVLLKWPWLQGEMPPTPPIMLLCPLEGFCFLRSVIFGDQILVFHLAFQLGWAVLRSVLGWQGVTLEMCKISQQMKITATRKSFARLKNCILPFIHVQILAHLPGFEWKQAVLAGWYLMPELPNKCTNKALGTKGECESCNISVCGTCSHCGDMLSL